MRTDNHFTKEYLQSLFTYHDGNLYWKIKKGRIVAGSIAGTRSHHYHQVCIDYKIYRTHRVIWAYHNGPSSLQIDHINNNSFDNRIENLRECNSNQNQYNKKKSQKNVSGIKGIGWSKQKQKWRARLRVDGIEHHVGFFDDLESAKKIISEKRKKLHGFFARDN